MPENNSIWKMDATIHQQNLWKLGNLALLSAPLNINISNKVFNEKKYAYASSNIYPNNQLANFEIWTENEIKARQMKLFESALEIWKK